MSEINDKPYMEKKDTTKKLTKEQLIIDGETLDEINDRKEKLKEKTLNE